MPNSSTPETKTPTFYHSIKEHYDYIFPKNPKQTNFIVSELSKKSRVLDIGCATGSLVLELAEHEMDVHGIDLDEGLLRIAAQKRHNHLKKPTMEHLNMLEIAKHFGPRQFDAITCFGNTLSHLNPSDAVRFFKSAHNVLSQKGQLMGQIVNYERLFALGHNTLPTIENEHVQFVRNYENFQPGQPFTFHTVLTDKKRQSKTENRITLYPFTQAKLKQQLKDAGFIEITFYGSFDKAPADNAHFPLIFTAQKSA